MMATTSAHKATKSAAARQSLGHLKSFGLTDPWQVALLLPTSWDNLAQLVERFNIRIPAGTACAVAGRLAGPPEIRFGNGAPRLIGSLLDPSGNKLGFSVFGDTREFEKALRSARDRVILYGQIDPFDGRNWLKNPELVSENWIGRLRPRYSGKTGVIKPETVRERVLKALKQAIPLAADFLAHELAEFGNREKLAELAGLRGWSLESIIFQSHLPKNEGYGSRAQMAMEYFAALGILSAARRTSTSVRGGGLTSLKPAPWESRASAIPFQLTDEQERAIRDTLADIDSPTPMRRMLTGDVGTGKTAVYGTISASVVDANGSVAILLPNESLASQVAREFTTWWPDLPLQLATGDNRDEVICGSIVVGTTALLYRDLGHPSLVIVDEQQKFSREQREQLVGPETHLLEVSATCIPRSQALARYGIVQVSQLRKCHTQKTIHTRIWQKHEWSSLFHEVQTTIEHGDQVLLVYPLREKGEGVPAAGEEEGSRKTRELRSASEIFEKWSKYFPERVRLIHGQMSDDEKESALSDMREGRAAVLVGTTVIEVGINIPRLRRVVVVHPDRHGLTTLHQIRGRVARQGGEGWCDLFLPHPVKAETMERLRVLEKCQDGFEVAEHDMRLRGIGDLSQSSTKQSGADDTFLYGRPVKMEMLDKVMNQVEGLV